MLQGFLYRKSGIKLSFRHTFVRVVRVADIHVAWLVYLAYLSSHVLRAYCNF